MKRRINQSARTGGVYIAVLGASLIAGLLGISALVGQRIQNRVVTSSVDIRQAQLNANSAIEVGLLMMKQESNWRTSRSNGPWFSARETGAGTCTLEVIDPLDGNLSNDPDDPVVMVGIGYRGDAMQRVRLTVEPQTQALSSLRSAVAAGDTIDVNADTVRTDGLITANRVSATASQVFGEVEAVDVSGSTFAGTATQIDAAKLPTMPNWSTVFNYYQANGTEISIGALPSTMPPNLARNPGIESGASFWTGSPPETPTAQVSQSTLQKRGSQNSLRVENRTHWQAGAAQRIDAFVKPGQAYTVEVYVMLPLLALLKEFRLSLHTKGTADAVDQSVHTDISVLNVLSLSWIRLRGTLTAPIWNGDLEYAFIKVAGANSGNTNDFFIDDVTIQDLSSGKVMFRRVLGPGVNPFPPNETNQQGIYWINCNGQRLTIDRSRIHGTLLVINPGPGSGVASGPIHWSPVVAGYPALLVDATDPANADFTIRATNKVLSEADQGINYNPAGAPHEQFGTDNDTNDIYQSGIRGLVAIEGDFVFQNRPFILGQLLVGGSISNSTGELEVDYQLDSLLNPPPGFLAPYAHSRRPGSVEKAVLP